MSQVAVGLENGVVILVRGDLTRDRFTKSKVVYEGSESVSGLGFREEGKTTTLFIVTLARILTCSTSNKDVTQPLDDQGCDFGGAILTPQDTSQEMVIGRNEAVYFYGLDGRGPCFIIDGPKTCLTWFRGYLAIVTRGPSPSTTSTVPEDPDAPDAAVGTLLTLYDLKNKFIAYTGSFRSGARAQGIRCVLGEWGELFVVTEDRKMYRLEEKDLDTKLDILFKKNMYALAINLVTSTTFTSEPAEGTDPSSPLTRTAPPGLAPAAPTSEYDYGTVVEIHKRYGDWLYSKSDYDAAMTQYQHTIGQLEPSYVIRKFLDAQRIHNLTSYLHSLHERGLANSDHTTLLLNCYTKLKDSRRLDAFIRSERDAAFDVETAIRVCRSGGYHEHALWLAEKFAQHGAYLQIQVDDLQRYPETVAYVGRMRGREVVRELGRHGHVLVSQMPEAMTDVLVRLCTEAWGDDPGAVAADDPAEVHPEDFVHLYVDRPEWCVHFLEKVLQARWGIGRKGKSKEGAGQGGILPDASEREIRSRKVVCNTLLELYLDDQEGLGREKMVRLPIWGGSGDEVYCAVVGDGVK
ncbi:hypothetical protein BDK51DRAFT_22887 [Blyttiomyces helicus]|uniref:PEP5/VPS11 N-terminal domain-containing protein n=1 Tax=Blyttiomyces helicus TaxID=388810 RepID=A0A4P9W736_9FUNG|nr:hypothetical protein BDK51DRAFT_22887 [Blyttiomyces helicus]|eukprot:RKO86818.1 hypothetical protein BDK51DRAFT_22887 [Blyttiomyces helicus]